MKPAALIRRGLFYLLVTIIVVYSIFPFYYAILSSLKSGTGLFRIDYFPFEWNFDNYVGVFREYSFAKNILNSVIVSFSVVAISLPAPSNACTTV